ncbi:protein FAM166A isoform X2 [Numida meleagris]|uniref:protein FAM166A isoform X2 n=1 Tax=Numida meleagris TaxID=8996 RepID=UPI000B3E15EA|nr:protein FAM166A isoform X2 [Numida meleagris]
MVRGSVRDGAPSSAARCCASASAVPTVSLNLKDPRSRGAHSITEVSRVTAACPHPIPPPQCCCAMAAPRQSGLFPPHPHHIPGYEGFVPQYNYQFGETYGKTTYRLLTDPHVRRSPRSVLAPLCKQRFIEDFSGTQHGLQPFLPAQPGYFPYDRAKALTNFPEAEFGPKPPAPGPAEEELAHTDPCYGHGGSGLSRCPPSPAWDPVGRPEGQEWQLPPIPAACGQDRQRGAGTAAGTGQAVRAEGVTPPAAADYRLPRLDVPGVIQQKVIPGYTGYIPRFTWVLGANYLRGVKEAMADFDRQQAGVRADIASRSRAPCQPALPLTEHEAPGWGTHGAPHCRDQQRSGLQRVFAAH